MNSRVSIGTDPEFFIKNKVTGKFVSSIPYIKGDKHNPLPLPSGGNIQQDNVAVEFATKPARTTKEFIEVMRNTFRETMGCLPDGYELSVTPSALFPEEELQDEKAKQFGCMPDYCAWDLVVNESPSHPDARFRSCGGHVHISPLKADGTPVHPDSAFLRDDMGKVWMVRGMDLFAGIIFTTLDTSKEAVERRVLYGKAGCHRPVPAHEGVEYRALSNFWTRHPMTSMLVKSLVEDVITVIKNGTLEKLIDQVGPDTIRNTINTGDVEKAREIIDSVLMPYLSADSKFFLEESIAKVKPKDNLSAEWGL